MTVDMWHGDVALGWRPLTSDEVVTAEGLIPQALVLLGAQVPDLGLKSPDLVKLVVAKMVRRVLKNPEGYRVRDVSIDDYKEGGTLDSSLSTGELYVSSDELSWLGVKPARARAFEIRLGGS